MAVDNLTDERKEYLLERGPISGLELEEWELEGLSPQSAMRLRKMAIFLRAFAIRGIVLDGCEAAQVSRSGVDKWRSLEWFDILYHAATAEAADRIEAEAYRRAVTGYDEPVVYQGQMTQVIDSETGDIKVLSVRKYSDTLMTLMLKGALPDKYRERQQIEHSGGAGGVLVVPAAVDPESWAKAAKEQQAKYAGRKDD